MTAPSTANGHSRVRESHPCFVAVVWGKLDLRTVDGQGMTDTQVAGYIAKYATKRSGAAGTVDRPLACDDCAGLGRIATGETLRCRPCHGTGLRYHLDALQVSSHARPTIDMCWSLGGRSELEHLRLRPWAHMLAFRGHFSTRSRRHSTTFGALRTAPSDWRTAEMLRAHVLEPEDIDDVVVDGHWSYAGRGYSDGEAAYALTVASDLVENRRLARQIDEDEQ